MPSRIFARIAERKAAESQSALSAVAASEVQVRKQQLFVLVEEKERAVADEVRAQVAVLTEQARQEETGECGHRLIEKNIGSIDGVNGGLVTKRDAGPSGR